MSTSRYFDRICAIILICAMVITILFMNGQSLGITLVVNADSETHSDDKYFTDNDQLSDWDISSATYITLEGDAVSISGNNAYEYSGNVVIAGSGKYVVSGTLDDGYITVNANANSKVWILLSGVDISCSDNACLRVDEADKVFLTLNVLFCTIFHPEWRQIPSCLWRTLTGKKSWPGQFPAAFLQRL